MSTFVFDSLSPSQLVILATVLAILLSCDLDSDETGVLGNFFSSLGQSLQTISAQQQLLEDNQKNKDQLDTLCCQVEQINQQLQQLKKQSKG